jgi:integrase
VRGSVYQRCSCRDQETRKPLGRKCPKLRNKGHATGWFFRYDAPRGLDGKRRRPEGGPFPTQRAAEEELAATLARLGGGAQVPDRSLLTGAYLDAYIKGKLNLKPRTLATNREIINLYWKPALGYLRLVDLRDHHVAEAVREMTNINRPLPDGERPSEMLRRMLDARADDERRHLAPGEKRRKKSAKPLSAARITRAFAVLRAAMNAAVPRKIMVNPCDGVELPSVPQVKPLAWTPQREAAFRTALDKQIRYASGERDLTTVQKQEMWASPDLRPCKVMVWLPVHTGKFLDFIEAERLFALFSLAAYCGLRRDEVAGLTWAEVDLDEGIAFVRETGSGDGPKSESGVRAVPLPAPGGAGTEGLEGAAGHGPARLGPRLDGYAPGVHPRGRDGRAGTVDQRPLRDPRLPRRASPGQVPRPPPRSRVAVQGGRGRHEADQRHARPLADQLHRRDLRAGVPGGGKCRRGARRRSRAPCERPRR